MDMGVEFRYHTILMKICLW